jgi:DNA-binding LacI/PurR family transcriptional regulator
MTGRVPLSTINQGSIDIGHSAAELLLECMGSTTPRPPKRILLPLRLIVRESSRRRG